MSELALNAARRSGDVSLIKLSTERNNEVQEIQSANLAAASAVAALKAQADDANANLAVGKLEAFVRGDWAVGLPRLAMGSDPQLKSLALTELARPTGPASCMALADAWWDRSAPENGLARKHLQSHAAFWYSQAGPELSGLKKAKAEKRSRESADNCAGSDPCDQSWIQPRPRGNLADEPDSRQRGTGYPAQCSGRPSRSAERRDADGTGEIPRRD